MTREVERTREGTTEERWWNCVNEDMKSVSLPP